MQHKCEMENEEYTNCFEKCINKSDARRKITRMREEKKDAT